MKKLLALLLTLAMLISMIACSTTSTSTDDEDEDEESSASSMNKVSIESTVLYEENDVKITANSLEYDKQLGVTLKFTVTNNRAEAITISSQNCSINDLMFYTAMLYCQLDAGASEETEMFFAKDDLETANITLIQTIEFGVHAYNPETYDTLFNSELLTLTTSADESYEQTFNDSGDLLYEDDNVRIVVQGLGKAKYLEAQEIKLFIENKSESDWTIQCDTFSVNGTKVSAVFSTTVPKGKKAFDSITIYDEDLEASSIETIQTVELSLRIIDWDTYANNYISDPLTHSFN